MELTYTGQWERQVSLWIFLIILIVLVPVSQNLRTVSSMRFSVAEVSGWAKGIKSITLRLLSVHTGKSFLSSCVLDTCDSSQHWEIKIKSWSKGRMLKSNHIAKNGRWVGVSVFSKLLSLLGGGRCQWGMKRTEWECDRVGKKNECLRSDQRLWTESLHMYIKRRTKIVVSSYIAVLCLD